MRCHITYGTVNLGCRCIERKHHQKYRKYHFASEIISLGLYELESKNDSRHVQNVCRKMCSMLIKQISKAKNILFLAARLKKFRSRQETYFSIFKSFEIFVPEKSIKSTMKRNSPKRLILRIDATLNYSKLN